MKPTALALLLAAAPCAAQADPQPQPAAAAHWNQWRGPERSGHCPAPAWPRRLQQEALARQWRVPLGPSYSGPIVDGERVYTTETADGTHEVVRALDRRTGEQIWEARWPGSMEVPFFAKRNGSWIRSTPALDEQALYVAGMLDVLVCLDAASGEERWRVDLADRFGVPHEAFGFVCSPMVRGDSVYVQASPGMVKLDKRTGATVWTTLEERGGMMGGAFSSPVFATLLGQPQIVVQTRAELAGVDDSDGKVLWRTKVRSFRDMNILTPTPFGDGVFTSAYGGRGHFFALAESDGEWSVNEKWDSRAQGYMTSPVVIGKHAYLYLRSKRFTCVDLETGESGWISEPFGDEYWSLVAQDDRILALSETGDLRLIAANPEEFELIDTVAVSDSETWAHVAVDCGQLFVREQDGLSAYAW